ncbi:MAG: hypothetical protein RLZZ15_2775 [Verrucomicrobiota bacterium]|jgi:hypothetical protein
MKKWMYIIFPGIMLGLFLAFYFTHKKEADALEEKQLMEARQKEAAEVAKKKKAEQEAAANARENQRKHDEAEKSKEETRNAKQAAADKEVKDKTEADIVRADKASKEVAAREIELDALRKKKEQINKEAFELAKQVELAKIARRNAELESQRMHGRISRIAGESSLSRMPPPMPVPPTPPKS